MEVSLLGISWMYLPSRMTMTRSATAMTSWSLWVMMMMLLPIWASLRMVASSSSTSWGVSTAEGSSKMMMSASWYRTFRISTRCCNPTGQSFTSRRGSMWRPYLSHSSSVMRMAAFRSKKRPFFRGSRP